MSLSETCGRLTTAETTRVAIVLDASESAWAHWADVAALAQGLVNALPASVGRSIHFLGNPAPYPVANLGAQLATWFSENRRRASLITPLFEAMRDDTTRTVVIGSGPIFDLEDWAGTPQLARTLLVSLGEPLQAHPAWAEELTRPSAQDLCRRLHDPPVRVEISGPGFMPTRWDNLGYQLAIAHGTASLVADRLQDYAIALQYFVGASSSVAVTVTHASGARSHKVLEPTASTILSQASTNCLNRQEVEAFGKARRRRPFSCPVCGAQCSWNTLRCRGEGGFSHLAYPSVEAQRLSGFVLLREIGKDVSFTPLGVNVLKLYPSKVAIKAQGQLPAIYHFDSPSGTWVQTQDPMEQYLEVDENVYAIFV